MNSFHSNTKINNNPGDRNTTLIRLVGASLGLLIFIPQNNVTGHSLQENLTYMGAAIVAILLLMLGLQWRKMNPESVEEFPTSKS